MITEFSGNIVDVINNRIYPGIIKTEKGKIIEIKESNEKFDNFIIPGFVDSHIHIESSMLRPSEFSRIAVTHGTVATVSDPHEIANVMGINGVKYMIEDGKKTPFKFYFCAPSCVPATPFETAGAKLGVEDLSEIFKLNDVPALSEMMNFPGVINDDPEVLAKIDLAKKLGKLIDGHCPGLRGTDLKKYVEAGISTDHECFTKEEALEKLSLGMKVQIREGSAARNFDELLPIAQDHYPNCMFCSDDKHPDDLIEGHINLLVKRAVKKGIDVMKVLQMSSVNPIMHYGLDVGLLQTGDSADFIIVDNLDDFNVQKTIINGGVVFEEGSTILEEKPAQIVNNFKANPITIENIQVPYSKGKLNVIEALDGQLITKSVLADPMEEKGFIVSDLQNDILKIVVVNRYISTKPAVGFVKGFGLKTGAIASSVAHDSYNIIAVGVSDTEIVSAINSVIKNSGGISAVSSSKDISVDLALPIAGLMSDMSYSEVAKQYSQIDAQAKSFGSQLRAPFMTLSFMALLVIPEIKISDKGLFDGNSFKLIPLVS